jgi:hypothetical protein
MLYRRIFAPDSLTTVERFKISEVRDLLEYAAGECFVR